MAREISEDKPGMGCPKKMPVKMPKKNPQAAAISVLNNMIVNNNNRIGMDRRAINLLWDCFSSRETPVFGMKVNSHQLIKDKIG